MTKTMYRHTVPLEYNTKYISKSDVRVYRDAILLTPGKWSDSVTRAEVEYTDKALSKYATNWTRNILDLDHNLDVLSIIGTIEHQRFQKNSVIGDLYIHPITQNARDTISLIDAGYVNSLSVELMADDVWDSSRHIRMADNIEFIGCAVLAGHPARPPACKDTRIR